MEQKVLNQSLKGLDFKAYFACVLLGILTKFSVNPYYEPLSWFVMYSGKDEINENECSTTIM